MIIGIILILLITPILYSMTTKNPEGTNVSGNYYSAQDVEFLYDLSYERDGERVHEQRIFDRQVELIRSAEEFLLLDIFLFNDDYTKGEIKYRDQVSEMSDLLIEKKKENPSMPIVLITDPINNFYGAYEEDNITRLKKAGIQVEVTDLNKMRDSSPLTSGGYRAYLQWFGTGGLSYIPNFFDKEGPKVNIRSILKLANFKGNHRKVYVSEKEAIVSSSNPHDPSSLHSNVAVKFYGESMKDLIDSELILVENPPEIMKNWKVEKIEKEDLKTRVITEKEIYNTLAKNISQAEKGDKVWIGIFYISDFDILESLGKASEKGVEVNIVADVNKDAFGLEKNGSPNRPALSELKEKYPRLNIKWYVTDGEQFHTKIAYFDYKDQDPIGVLGSANFTRRNLKDFNLETDVELIMQKDSALHQEIDQYFNRIWANNTGNYTVEMEEFKEDSTVLRTLWKIQEQLGLCTW